jgi:hypothetical protein
MGRLQPVRSAWRLHHSAAFLTFVFYFIIHPLILNLFEILVAQLHPHPFLVLLQGTASGGREQQEHEGTEKHQCAHAALARHDGQGRKAERKLAEHRTETIG